jgi:Protein of unknown function, DUF547
MASLFASAQTNSSSSTRPRISRRTMIGVLIGGSVTVLGTGITGSTALAASLKERFAAEDAASTTAVDHSAWAKLLTQYLKPATADGPSRLDYAGFKKTGRADLASYLGTLQQIEPAKLTRAEQFAFWINLYNAVTVAAVLDKYPVKSIKDVALGGSIAANFSGGPWDAKLATISGVALSLNDIEHQILRPIARDPRIHYAVNCASIGCPSLLGQPFTGRELNAMLDTAARGYINSPNGVRVADGKITVSSIFDWYKADFGDFKSLRKHLASFAEPELAKAIKAASRFSYGYDWKLNDTNGA